MKIHSKLTDRRLFRVVLALVLSITTAGLGLYTAIRSNTANAVSARDFRAGNIISDYVFYNKNAMNTQQIQDFLNRLIPNCLTWNPTTFVDGEHKVVGPPYVCINNYHENPHNGETSFERGGGWFPGGISAAQIIYNAAQEHGINPQVLLVMLKKESLGPLTSDNWPTKYQYKYAMGYACPDSGPNHSANCSASKAGFYKQVNLAAWQLRYYREHPNDYRYSLGWNNIQYSPNPACGTKPVYIENIATLSLYIYTPYTPNDGALANYPGTAPCGAYGNRNFFMFFSQWFGSTTAGSSIDMMKAKQDIDRAYNTHKDKLGLTLTDKIVEFDAAPRVWQAYQRGTIVWTSTSGAQPVLYGEVYNRWKALGGSNGLLGVPTSITTTETDKRTWQSFRNGTIIHSQSTGAWELQNGPIFDKWRAAGGSLGSLGKPTSSVIISNSMRKQLFEHGAIARRNVSSPAHIIQGEIYKTWNSPNNQAILKSPSGEQVIEPSDGRIWQYFDGGLVVHTNQTFIVKVGAFHNAWKSIGGSNGSLGKPTSNQISENGRNWQSFERGILIQKTSLPIAYAMPYGDIFNRWRVIGGSTSILGLPNSNLYTEADGRSWQSFEHGYIISSKHTGTWDIVDGFYKYWSAQGGSLGRLGKPTSARTIESNGVRWQTFERGKAVWSIKDGWKILQN